MEEYRYPEPETDTTRQPRRRRRAAEPAEGMPNVQQPPVQACPPADAQPYAMTEEGGDLWHTAPQHNAPVPEDAFAPQQQALPPQWQARPGFAPEQRTVRISPVQDPYHYTPPVQTEPPAAPVASPKVVKPPVPEQAAPPAPPAPPAAPAARTRPVAPQGESYFDGKLLQQIGYGILGFLVTALTLGICFPWVVCKMYAWRTKHTVIQGHRLVFDGKATQLFGRWLLWLLLSIVTLGIYLLWVGIALEKWRVKHTRFAN